VLRSAFQIYLPFRSRENIQSHKNFRSVDNEEQDQDEDAEINRILEEDDDDSTDLSTAIKVLNKADGDEAEGGVSDVKLRSGENRFKRNIKNTRSLIVRKFTSSRRSETKDSEDMKEKREKREEQTAECVNVKYKDKPNTKQQQQQQQEKEKNVVMLRTTTL